MVTIRHGPFKSRDDAGWASLARMATIRLPAKAAVPCGAARPAREKPNGFYPLSSSTHCTARWTSWLPLVMLSFSLIFSR